MNRDVVRYGPDADQFAEVWRADGPAVVLLHGGYWRRRYGLDLMRPLAADLVGRGYTVANLEYRRMDTPGGGWPGTFDDIAAGLDALGFTGYAVVGHSAGGHLALWSCSLPRPPAFAVSLAGICDLVEGARLGLSAGAVVELLGGGPLERPDVYARVCPTLLLPVPVPRLVVHGTADRHVPYELTVRYAAAAGDLCRLLSLPDVDHFALIDPASAAWAGVAGILEEWRAGIGSAGG